MSYYVELDFSKDYEGQNFENGIGELYELIDAVRGVAKLIDTPQNIPGTDCPAGKCSQCNELVPNDSIYCCYCGARFLDDTDAK